MRQILFLITIICGTWMLRAAPLPIDSITTPRVMPDSLVIDTATVAFLTEDCGEPSLYAYPYSVWRRNPNWTRVLENTAVLFGAGFATLGVLELLPANTTAWNKKEMQDVPFFKRWWKHVRVGPVWDSDLPIFNYILHPYAGAAYYMGARSQGFNVLGSFLYTTFISSIFWEYGIEAFNEVPSIQDLVITPIGGTVLGEAFYLAKRRIVENGYRLCGSKVLGNIVAIVIDPVNEVLGFIFGNSARSWVKRREALEKRGGSVSSFIGPQPGMAFGLSVSAVF